MKLRTLQIVLLTALTAATASAQTAPPQSGAGAWDPTGLQLTRPELEALLTEYETMATSSSYSGKLRQRAEAEAALIRQRLSEGDLRVGDRIELIVEGHANLTNTFNVVAGRIVVLPGLALTPTEVPLDGVLRSELQPHMQKFIERFIRNPVVHARSLVRLEVMGAVGKPGFYMLPSDMLFSEALMAAGGVAGAGDLDRIRVERGGEVIWDRDQVREAIREGRTLDQLSINAGDAIFVDQKTSRFTQVRTVLGVISSLGAIFWMGRRAGVF
ncbi:MAG TPA: SLBB domain-containing protein [Longimicrobiales bacterium]|nr:SLBB domain-containing protein [Longimicrobiales bacterium]